MTLCGWSARQTISLFWCEAKKRHELKISDETGSRGGKAGPREARGTVGKGMQRGAIGKRT